MQNSNEIKNSLCAAVFYTPQVLEHMIRTDAKGFH